MNNCQLRSFVWMFCDMRSWNVYIRIRISGQGWLSKHYEKALDVQRQTTLTHHRSSSMMPWSDPLDMNWAFIGISQTNPSHLCVHECAQGSVNSRIISSWVALKPYILINRGGEVGSHLVMPSTHLEQSEQGRVRFGRWIENTNPLDGRLVCMPTATKNWKIEKIKSVFN